MIFEMKKESSCFSNAAKRLATTICQFLALWLITALSPSSVSAQTLLQKQHLVYQGAFRLPHGVFGGSSFEYGGKVAALETSTRRLSCKDSSSLPRVGFTAFLRMVHSKWADS